jgi:hypothetical protein
MKTNELKSKIENAIKNMPNDLTFDELVERFNEQGIPVTDEELFEMSGSIEPLQLYIDACGVMD